MTGEWGTVPRQRLMENITLLWTLNEIIELPGKNQLCEEETHSRQLPLEHEGTIADLLAFLSATHDDTHNITAVCIEEGRKRKSLTIRVASNTGDCLYLTKAFKEMARILEKAHSRGTVRKSPYCLYPLRQFI